MNWWSTKFNYIMKLNLRVWKQQTKTFYLFIESWSKKKSLRFFAHMKNNIIEWEILRSQQSLEQLTQVVKKWREQHTATIKTKNKARTSKSYSSTFFSGKFVRKFCHKWFHASFFNLTFGLSLENKILIRFAMKIKF